MNCTSLCEYKQPLRSGCVVFCLLDGLILIKYLYNYNNPDENELTEEKKSLIKMIFNL